MYSPPVDLGLLGGSGFIAAYGRGLFGRPELSYIVPQDSASAGVALFFDSFVDDFAIEYTEIHELLNGILVWVKF